MTSDPHDKDVCAKQGQEQQKTQVVEAEIIDDGNYNFRQYYQDTSQNSFGGVSFGVHGRGWRQHAQFKQSPSVLSCMPTIVTLVLALSLGIQYGFLATLGFFFFYLLGNAVSFAISLRRTLQGQKVFVWLNRALVWVGAYALTLAVI